MNLKNTTTILKNVRRALAADDLIPIFKCFAFNDGKVMAYNRNLGIVVPCDAQHEFAVDGATLLGLLECSKGDELEFTLEQQDVKIKAGKSLFRLPYYPSTDFLFKEPEFLQDSQTVKLPLSEEVRNALEACLLTSSRDMAQPAFMGVALLDGHTFYSCDGDAITKANVQGKSSKAAFMIHNEFCEALLRLMGDTTATDGTLELNSEWAKATLGNGYVIYGHMIELPQPHDYEGQIKKTVKDDPKFIKQPASLQMALARARVVADSVSAPTLITVADEKLRVVTETHMGVIRDAMMAKGHPPVTAKVSAALMARAAGMTDELAVLENCCVFRSGTRLYHLLSNMG